MLVNRKGIRLGWKLRLRILSEACDALLYLHERNILHRDIKTDNVMLTLDLKPKLIDLGFARVMAKDRAMTMCGTDEFMSPEVLFGMEYDERADVFSFGIVIAEVVTKKEPGKASKFLDRTPRSGFCVEMEEIEKEFKSVKCPAELLEICKKSCADEQEDRPWTSELFDNLHDIYMNTKDENEVINSLDENSVLAEINYKWERLLKHGETDNSTLAIDEDDFARNFLDPKTLSKSDIHKSRGKKNREESMAARRRSVKRGVRETSQMKEGKKKALAGYVWKKGKCTM